jgi:superfamily II DNA or RNA helicase
VTIRIQIKGALAKITGGSTKLVSKFLSVKNPKYFWEARSNPNAQEWVNFVDPIQKTFPAGLVAQLVKAASKRGITVDYNDTSGDHVKVNPKCLNGVVARDYQVIAAQHGLKHQRCVLEIPTGGGKSNIAAIICYYRRDSGPILIVVPSKHLLHQTAESLSAVLGEPVGKIGDGKLELNNRITVGIPASLAKGVQGDPKWSRKYNRMMKAPAAHPKTEAFIKSITTVIVSTPSGASPIESLRVGDIVRSYDEKSFSFVDRTVVRLFRKPVTKLCKILLANGRTIICTPEHPFLTKSGEWLAASCLAGNVVVLDSEHEKKLRSSELVPGGMRHVQKGNWNSSVAWPESGVQELSVEEKEIALFNQKIKLPRVWCTGDREWPQGSSGIQEKSTILFGGMQNSLCEQEIFHNRSYNKQKVCVGKNAQKKSNAERGSAEKSFCITEANWAPPPCTGREWYRYDSSARESFEEAACRFSKAIQARVCSKDSRVYRWRSSSALLQARYSLPKISLKHRSRRELAFGSCTSSSGSEARPRVDFVRVDSVEIQEQESSGGFGDSCRDGNVYNIEVAETHTYVVNGIVVHNCHHGSSDSWTKLLLSVPASVRIGLSGTADKRGSLDYWRLMAVAGPVVYRLTSSELIARGFLSRPKIAFITDEKVFGPAISSYKRGRTTAPNPGNDMLPWNTIYADAIVNNKHYNSAVAQFARSLVQRKHPTVVMCAQTTHIKNIVAECKRIGLKVVSIEGANAVATRMKALDNLVKKRDHVLVCSPIFDEGIDVPDIEAVVLAGGGKSLVKLIQRIGRVLRKKANGRNKAVIVDFGHSHNQHTAKHAIERVEECDRQGWEIVNVEDVTNFAKITRMA